MESELQAATARRQEAKLRLEQVPVQYPWRLGHDYNVQKGSTSCKDGKLIMPSDPHYWRSLGLIKNKEEKPASFVKVRAKLLDERRSVFLKAGNILKPTEASEEIRGKNGMFSEPSYDRVLLDDVVDYVRTLADEVKLSNYRGNVDPRMSLALEILEYTD